MITIDPNVQNIQTENLQAGEQLRGIWEQDPMRIIALLYEKLMLHTGRARSCLNGWGDQNCQPHIIKAVDVIEKLRITIDTSGQNAMAHNIDDLYNYIGQRLLSVAHEKNIKTLEEVLSLIHEIRSTIDLIVKKSPNLLQH